MIYKDDEGYEYVRNLKEIRELLKEKNDYWWGKERTDLDLKYYVPTDIICKEFEFYEVGIAKNVYDYIESVNKDKYFDIYTFAEYLEDRGFKMIDCGNTYNHSGRPQNDIDWKIYQINDDRFWVIVNFHLGGDIRGNYTDDIVLEFEYDTQFFEVLDDITSEYGLYFDLKVNNKVYEIAPKILDECLEVYDREIDDYIYGIWGVEDKEVIEQIKEKIGGKINENK